VKRSLRDGVFGVTPFGHNGRGVFYILDALFNVFYYLRRSFFQFLYSREVSDVTDFIT